MPPKRDWRVLCLDGGGVRGVIEGVFLASLERNTGKRMCELFDLICGTSTGGILAMMLGMFHMSCDDALKTYLELCGKIFGEPDWELAARTGVRYDTANFERIVKETMDRFIAGTGLRGVDSSQALMKTLPPGYHTPDGYPTTHVFMVSRRADDQIPGTYLWTNYPIQSDQGSDREPLWQCIRATSAAPSYFKTIEVGGRAFMDGGIGNNNPIFRAFQELARLGADMRESFLASVGCGQGDGGKVALTKQLASDKLDKLGPGVRFMAQSLVGKVAPAADLVLTLMPALLTAATDSDEPWVDAESMLRVCGLSQNAVRLQIPHTSEDLADMKVVPELVRRTEAALPANRAKLERIAQATLPYAASRRSASSPLLPAGSPAPQHEPRGAISAELPENRISVAFELHEPNEVLDQQCADCLLVDNAAVLERNVRLFRNYTSSVRKLASEATPEERAQAKEDYESVRRDKERAAVTKAVMEEAHAAGTATADSTLGWLAQKLGNLFTIVSDEEDILARIVAQRLKVDLDGMREALPKDLLPFAELLELIPAWEKGPAFMSPAKSPTALGKALSIPLQTTNFLVGNLLSLGWNWVVRPTLQVMSRNALEMATDLPGLKLLKSEILGDKIDEAATLYTIQKLYDEGKLRRAVGYKYAHPFRGAKGAGGQVHLDPATRIYLCLEHLYNHMTRDLKLVEATESAHGLKGHVFMGQLEVVGQRNPSAGKKQIIPVERVQEVYTQEARAVLEQALRLSKLPAPPAAGGRSVIGAAGTAAAGSKRKEMEAPVALRPGTPDILRSGSGSPMGSPLGSPLSSPPPMLGRITPAAGIGELRERNRASGYAQVPRIAD